MTQAGHRRVILLGCTGSIGRAVLEVIAHLHEMNVGPRFEVVGLAAGSNAASLAEQARTLGVDHVALADPAGRAELRDVRHVACGPGAALELVESVVRPGDLLVGAMVGAAGVPATLAAIERGADIALANKETLVAAGGLVMPAVARTGVTLLPIDSEHSAIFQCLLAGRSIDEVERLVITASGGPFRTWTREATAAATIEEALAHPTWEMGRKITIDSATLMNKALEVIEAHWLFDLPAERIEAIVHPQSIVHSFVEFVDGSTVAQLGPPDMRTPIQYALTSPHRHAGCSRTMDWANLRSLEFEPVDHDRFGALGLARQVIEQGGTAGAIFNAANEVAVAAFLDGRMAFGGITDLVATVMERLGVSRVDTMEDVLAADRAARDEATRLSNAPNVEIPGPGRPRGRALSPPAE
ncbi:MAG: 1-deoxy-D-xylulose-5-phosphate reductoisomerase [Planctomycetota bacterium]|jgi:1-deoxy-D-xylulose-5-phosphate reductoisomerase